MSEVEKNKQFAERLYIEWDKALANNDVDALLALYADDATLESPLVMHVLKQSTHFYLMYFFIKTNSCQNIDISLENRKIKSN